MKKVLHKLLVIIFFPIILLTSFFGCGGSSYSKDIIQAIKSDDVVLLKQLIDKGGDLNQSPMSQGCANFTESSNWPPLHYACQYGKFEAVKLLVEGGANVNLQYSNQKYTPLVAAFITPDYKKSIVKYLLENGADPLLSTTRGENLFTELGFADVQFANEIITILHNQGAFERAEQKDKNILFDHACRGGALMVMEFVLSNNYVNINAIIDNQTFLMRTVRFNVYKGVETVELLLNNGADKTIKDNNGKTALDIAIEKDLQDIIPLLQD